jgi:hypothetical protein
MELACQEPLLNPLEIKGGHLSKLTHGAKSGLIVLGNSEGSIDVYRESLQLVKNFRLKGSVEALVLTPNERNLVVSLRFDQ